jgi:hypothetical protein
MIKYLITSEGITILSIYILIKDKTLDKYKDKQIISSK